MKGLRITLILLVVLTLIYLVGPKPAKPNYTGEFPFVPENTLELDKYVLNQEQSHRIKPNNEARIVWANDTVKEKTPYAIVYLHGFSACQEEGNPVHRNLAKKLGCNLYLSRLSQHGIDTPDALLNMTAENLWASAKQAYAIGKTLGNKVIIMGTSTGGTLALKLAATYPEIAGIILYSPNIEINNPTAWILNNPWGLQIARLVTQSKLNTAGPDTPLFKQYWHRQYRLESTVQLEHFVETAIKDETLKLVNQPALALYYYKDEANQDKVVKVEAIKHMMEKISTPPSKKEILPIPNAGDHVLASPILSKDIETVEAVTLKFIQEKIMK